MTRRAGLVSPDVVSRDMNRVLKLADEIAHLAETVRESYEAAYDASLSNGRQGIEGNGRGRPLGDPTGDLAVSGMHRRMRWRVRRAGRHIRRAMEALELAESEVVELFAETDEDFREKLRRLSELEEAGGIGR